MNNPRSRFMASSRYLQVGIIFLVLSFRTLYAHFDVSFDKGSNVDPSFALHGGAELASGAVQFSGAGRVAFKQPVKLRNGESFSSRFGFSMSGGNVDGVAFLMAPAGYPANVFGNGSFGLVTDGRNSRNRFLAVEFDTRKDSEFGDLNANHVGVDVASLVSAKVSNVSVNLSLNSGKKLQAWIDYQASSKRFEIRLGEAGESKPLGPLLSYMVDLSRMWGETELFFSLSSAVGNGSECKVYSWEMKLRTVPRWMHSQPLDPNASVERVKQETLPATVGVEKQECTFRVVGALILGVGCGALGALIVLFVWTLLGLRRPVVPEDYAKQEQLEFEYDKAKVVDVLPSGKNMD